MRLSFLFLLFFSYTKSFAQKDLSEASFKYISDNIATKQKLNDTENALQQMLTLAINENKPVAKVRCLYYQVLIKDLKTEDTLYFKNSALLEKELAQTIINAPEAMLHLLMAKRINYFKNYYLNKPKATLFKNENGLPNYAGLTYPQIDSLIHYHYKQAIEISLYSGNQKVEEFIWLSQNPLLFLYKPILYDVANAEYISYYKTNNYQYIQNSDYLNLTADELMQQGDTLSAFKGDAKKVFNLYKNWASIYTYNPQAYYYIETLMRVYFNQYTFDKNKNQFYQNYLDRLLQSPYNTVKAAGLFYSIKNKMQQAPQYNNVEINYGNIYNKTFDTSKRLLYVESQNLYTKNNAVLDSFNYLKEDLEEDFDVAKKTIVRGWMKDYQLPNTNPSFYIKYKNCSEVVVKISKVNDLYNLQSKSTLSQQNIIYSLPIFTIQNIKLPELNDWQYHNVNVPLQKLAPGNYVLQYKTTQDSSTTISNQFACFTVTDVALINNDEKVFILYRNTGKPLQNATVSFGEIKDNQQIFETTRHNVNAQGFVVNKNDKQFAKVFYGNDTTVFTINKKETVEKPRYAYDEEEYDTKQDFYEENLAVQIFTDRAIYRPGQTVYFKGLATIPDVHTGKPLPLTIKNLKLPFFQKLLLKYFKAFTKKRPQIYINDAFNKVVDTIKFTPNKFGSFWGKYVIPKNAPTGEWGFDNEYSGSGDYNDGTFKVEEYKRPTYEITIEQPKAELYLTDSVTVKVKVKSFAGVQLNNVKIEYTVNKSYSSSLYQIVPNKFSDAEIIDTTGYTNEKGELLIKIPADEIVKKIIYKDSIAHYIQYSMSAEAVDETGEAYDANISFQLKNQPIRITTTLPRYIDNNAVPPIKITTGHNLFGSVEKTVKVQLYKINEASKLITDELPQDVDINTGLYKPQITIAITPSSPDLKYETILQSNTSSTTILQKIKLEVGNYLVKFYCIENGKIIGTRDADFKVFDTKNNVLPNGEDFVFLPIDNVKNNDTLKWILGENTNDMYTIYHIAYFEKNNKKISMVNDYVYANEIAGVTTFSYKVPKNAIDKVNVTRLYINNNQIIKNVVNVYVYKEEQAKSEIILEKYRTTLLPGGKETFKVSIKTKNKNALAELMSTMYDASLDKIEKHEWHLPREDNNLYVRNNWNSSISSFNDNDLKYSVYDYNLFNNRQNLFAAKNGNVEPLWWLNPLDYAYDEFPNKKVVFQRDNFNFQHDMNPDIRYSGYAFGVKSASLNEVVVTSALNRRVNIQNGLTGRVAGLNVQTINSGAFGNSRITLRGIRSLTGNDQPLIILDGIPFNGDLSTIEPSAITDMVVLKGASGTILYGEAGSHGVFVISTKGPIQFPQPQEPQLTVRKNFNETAFFFPAIHADNNGYYNIEFTMPESVTEWKWKLFAHTKKMDYSYLEKIIYTQLPLMVQPNMPRFLYQGDKIKLQSRISNLDTVIANGKIECIIEDVITGENITSKIIQQNSKPFSVAAQSNGSNGFNLSIPNNLLHPIKIIIKVISKNFADGEEHIIPILAKKILVTQAVPFVFNTSQTTITSPVLPNDAEPYAQGLFVAPQPQAALVNALPSMAFYKFNCAEQLSGKILAYATAIDLMRKDSALRNAYANLSAPNNEVVSQLPDEINEQTMPWLTLQKYTANHQMQLVKLLDTVNAKQQIQSLLKELLVLQNTDGGFTWFKGGKTDKYISEYLLSVFGKLKLHSFSQNDELKGVIKKLIDYVDMANNSYEIISNNYMYCRSFWRNEFNVPDANKTVIKNFVGSQWGKVSQYNLYQQALLILNTQTYLNDKSFEYEQAIKQLQSIEQLAITDDENGMRWKALSDEDDISISTEETIALLATVFKNNGKGTTVVNNIIKWLHTAKQEHSWSSTKSTAAVVSLLNENKMATTQPTSIMTTIGNKKMEATNNLVQNKPTDFILINQPSFQNNIILNQQTNTTAKGNVLYYYFTENPPVNNSNILLKKELFYFNKQIKKDELVTANTTLQTGDKVMVRLTIETQKLLQYVFIEDKRAAALEPVDNLSDYEYGNGIGYYKSVRDVGVQFFANSITPGKHTIIYEAIVMKEGIFTNGIASLQCMYKPGVKVYSAGSLEKLVCGEK